MDSHDIETYFRHHRRILAVLLLVVCMTAASGVFIGMRQTDKENQNIPKTSHLTHDPLVSGLPVAPKYNEIANSGWLANEDWKYTLQQLPRTNNKRMPTTALGADELREILAARAENRAFDGAPPTVPHDIQSISSKSCMLCHAPDADLLIGEKRPAAMSHPYYANCTQCHAPSDGLRKLTAKERLIVATNFDGRDAPGSGSRAYPGAPPMLPHAVFMRQNCMSCHGPSRPNAIRTSHPQRQNCLQCHAPDADHDNRERFHQSPPQSDP